MRSTDARVAILQRVHTIPPGYVLSYGDISPGAPRLAGYVLSQTDAREAPWHRVVRADGSLAKGARQRRLLEAEEVPVPRRAGPACQRATRRSRRGVTRAPVITSISGTCSPVSRSWLA